MSDDQKAPLDVAAVEELLRHAARMKTAPTVALQNVASNCIESWLNDHGEELLAAMRRLAKLEAAQAWRPIADAPDYEAVLIFVPPFAPMQGTKSGTFKDWMVGARCIFGRSLAAGMEPTHWLPLPAPPKTK